MSKQSLLQASDDGDRDDDDNVGALSRQRLLQAMDDGDAGALRITMATAMTLLHLDAFRTYPMQSIQNHRAGDALERAAFRGLDERRVYTLSLLPSAMVATHS